MISKQKSLLRAPLVLSMILSVTACSRSDELVAVRPEIPEVPAKLASVCYDPGVDPDARVALTDQRVALASCREKHKSLIAFYRDVKEGME